MSCNKVPPSLYVHKHSDSTHFWLEQVAHDSNCIYIPYNKFLPLLYINKNSVTRVYVWYTLRGGVRAQQK